MPEGLSVNFCEFETSMYTSSPIAVLYVYLIESNFTLYWHVLLCLLQCVRYI